jgi:hypothetical protein
MDDNPPIRQPCDKACEVKRGQRVSEAEDIPDIHLHNRHP